jgi:hypothetical protein
MTPLEAVVLFIGFLPNCAFVVGCLTVPVPRAGLLLLSVACLLALSPLDRFVPFLQELEEVLLAYNAGERSVLETDFSGVFAGIAEEARFVGKANDCDHWQFLKSLRIDGFGDSGKNLREWGGGSKGAATRLARELVSAISRPFPLPWRQRGPGPSAAR